MAGGASVVAHLNACIGESIRFHLYDNATFLAERLYSLSPNEQNAEILGDCYLRQGKPHRAYHLLKHARVRGAGARYLLALAAFQLNKYDDAEAALTRNGNCVPSDAPSLHLLGRVCTLTQRADAARENYRVALQADPLMWVSFRALCEAGAAEHWHVPDGAREVITRAEPEAGADTVATGRTPDALAAPTPATPQAPRPSRPPLYGGSTETGTSGPALPPSGTHQRYGRQIRFEVSPETPAVGDVGMRQMADAAPSFDFGGGLAATPATATPGVQGRGHGGSHGHALPRWSATPGSFETPQGERMGEDPASGPPPAPKLTRAERQAAAADSRVELPGLTPAPEPTATPGNRKITDRSGKLRKVSNRLFAENASLPALPAASPPAPRQSAGLSAGRSAEGEAGALALLEPLAEAARLLAVLQWREALDVLGAAEEGLRGSAFALGLEGRARLEGGDLKGAVRAFRLMREADPGCLEGVDHYSTALWYTGAFAELASLARDALAWDRWAPEAWCAAGNCMSLQKDHATALKYFRRALQLDKNSVYAHTLCGHELQALDDLEGALQSYRAALALQPLHYNAWYGMSQVFARKEDWDMAEYHLQRAMQVHPTSSILKCHCAVAMSQGGRQHQALAVVQEAIRLDPKNPIARYERANLLLGMKRPKEALDECILLRDLAPEEAPVYALMGRAYRHLGQTDLALAAFTAALDLSPPEADTSDIRAAMDHINQPEDNEAEEL